MKRVKLHTFFYIITFITFIALFAWRLCTYFYSDDLIYSIIIPADDNVAAEPFVTTFSDACLSAYNHFLYANGRLCNLLAIYLKLVPRWVTNVIDASFLCAMFILLFKTAGVKLARCRARIAILGTALFWIAFAWYDTMMSADYIANYVWTSVTSMIIILLFETRRKFTRRELIACLVFAFFAGSMHEGFSCSVIAYAFFKWIFTHRPNKSQLFLIGLLFVFGTAVSVCSGTLLRLNSSGAATGLAIKYFPCLKTLYISQFWPLWLAIAVSIFCRFKLGKRRFRALRQKTFLNFAAIAVNALTAIVLGSLHRTLWPLQLFCVLQILMCAERMLPYRQNRYNRYQVIILLSGAIVYALWLGSLVKLQWRFTQEDKQMFIAMQKAEQPVVYFDMTDDNDVPYYYLGIVQHHWRENSLLNYFVAMYTRRQNSVIILPTKYKGVPLDSLKIPGSDHVCGVYPTMYVKGDKTVKAQACYSDISPAVTPIDRALMKLGPEMVYATVQIDSMPQLSPDIVVNGETYYLYFPNLTQRTVAKRRFVRLIDEQ